MKNLNPLELRISRFLRWGVLLAAGLISSGWLLGLASERSSLANFTVYQSRPLVACIEEAFKAQSWAVLALYAGLLVLISLPVLRVLLTAVLFVKQREYALAAVAAFVLGALAVSLLLGFEL